MNHQSYYRRGMILLLTLSMLTLFLGLGATFLVIATRARTASRAFTAASVRSDSSPVVPKMMLDEALLLLIRGSGDPAIEGPTTPGVLGESLLRDMYKKNKNRVPFRPEVANDFGVDNEEFHDSFTSDVFLTQIGDTGNVLFAAFDSVRPPMPARTPATLPLLEVDNDGDGVADGVWLNVWRDPTSTPANAPLRFVSAGGSTVSFRVSYLVLDLDGRVNVNAHGGAASGALEGPASIDIDASTFKAFGPDGWGYLRTGLPPPTTPGVPLQGSVPGNLRQTPIVRPSGTLPGRGTSTYALRLDLNAPRLADLTSAVGDPFTLGELERVLRPSDSDWATLPPRLSAILTDLDGAAKRTVTTDSWDVALKTGSAIGSADTMPEPKLDLSLDRVDSLSRETFANDLYDAITWGGVTAIANQTNATAQWCANVAEFREPRVAPGVPALLDVGVFTVTGAPPSVLGGPASDWPGGFRTAAELLFVPMGDKAAIDAIVAESPQVNPLVSLAASKPAIFEAVTVRSQFSATTANDPRIELIVDRNLYPLPPPQPIVRQVPVREPGRVNVNTCSDAMWKKLFGTDAPLPTRPTVTSVGNLLVSYAFTGGDGIGPIDIRKLDRTLANRLGGIATVRSNVFAVWVTLEMTRYGVGAPPPTCHRLFAIVDRTIPVVYSAGSNTVMRPSLVAPFAPVTGATDVRDMIRLKRYLN